MENSFFLFSNQIDVKIERFHICSWDFRNKTSITEFGIEIDHSTINNRDEFELKLYIPWLNRDCNITDFYSKLKDLKNSKFIFNDVATGHDVLDDNGGNSGCIQKFKEREDIVLLPFSYELSEQTLVFKLNLTNYNEKTRGLEKKPNVYFRFSIETKKKQSLALKKAGINKTTIIYDVKVNERRNIPSDISSQNPCSIKHFFYFNIVPNDYNLGFYNNNIFKSIRTLEYAGFKEYLNDKRIKRDDLIVISFKESNQKSYSIFNVFNNEVFGIGGLAMALLLNLLCGILLFIPSIRSDRLDHNIINLPWELYTAVFIWGLVLLYFIIKKKRPNWIKW